jgi:hypothetical protein
VIGTAKDSQILPMKCYYYNVKQTWASVVFEYSPLFFNKSWGLEVRKYRKYFFPELINVYDKF